MRAIFALLSGVYFGVILVKSEVASWFRIQAMFRFEEAHMYLIIGSAVGVAALSVWLIRRLGLRSIDGAPPAWKAKPFTKGTIVGGVIFGMGWAVTGACPGPIYAQVGGGEWMALYTLAGGLVGALLYAWLRPRLPH